MSSRKENDKTTYRIKSYKSKLIGLSYKINLGEREKKMKSINDENEKLRVRDKETSWGKKEKIMKTWRKIGRKGEKKEKKTIII